MSIDTVKINRREFGSGHVYSLRDQTGSRKLDGVTTLLNLGMPKPALVTWAAKVVAESAVADWDALSQLDDEVRIAALVATPNAERNAAAMRGREVHALAESLIAGDEVDVPDEIAGYVESAVQFMDAWQIRPLLTESVVFSQTHGYAGTLDLVCTSDLFPGEVIIADWKTSRSGIFSETALQLAAYRYADGYVGADGRNHPISDLSITTAWGVWIRSDGFDVVPAAADERAFDLFLHVCEVGRAARSFKKSPLIGAEMSRPLGPYEMEDA